MAEALLLLGGAVAGFAMVGFVAYGSLARVLSPPPRQVRVWAALHLLSAGVCVLLVYGVTLVVRAWFRWPLVGFTATAAYLLILGVQFRLAASARVECAPEPEHRAR
ncbi:MAG TPA: hypothetical protein VHC18_02690 [Amycolatopsis sp.]|nr:hypothetical protein [Amycolatopsis sp.]